MKRLYFIVIATIVVSTVLMAGACLSGSDSTPRSFAIIWNYDTSGYLETCGCSAHQLGGLARRSTKLAELRASQPVLAIEGANFVENVGEFQLFKGETIIRSLNAMDYDAMMFGFREAQHGAAGLRTLSELAAFPCFSANLELNSEPWDTRYAVVDIAGTQAGLTGISQLAAINFELPEEITFGDETTALELVLDELEDRCELVVVCLEGDGSWIREFARDYAHRVDVFLSGDRREVSANLRYSADPPLLNNWKYGKYLGFVTVDPLPGGKFSFAGLNIPLEDTISDDEEILTLLDVEYRAQLKDRFFSQMKVDLEQLYLPPDTCEPCHTDAYENYMQSKHSRAMVSLVDAGQVYNPDCMRCHVIYNPDLDELASMNCVVCHSNITEQHLWDAVEDNVVPPEQPLTTYTYDFCVQCHDELNDEAFRDHWPDYMLELYHGGDNSAAEAAVAAGYEPGRPGVQH